MKILSKSIIQDFIIAIGVLIVFIILTVWLPILFPEYKGYSYISAFLIVPILLLIIGLKLVKPKIEK